MAYIAPEHRGVTPGAAAPDRKNRFPGFDVLSEVHRWDAVTAGVVLVRLAPPPDLAFFTPAEFAVADRLCDQLLAQREETKVPVARLVDVRLAENETDGWRYEDMPEDRDAWRQTVTFLDDDARAACGAGFAELRWRDQAALIEAVRGMQTWHGFPAAQVWSLWTRYACAAFYSHPWAWNEIGFPGPAYPRGYKALGIGGREPFEVADHSNADPVPWAARVEEIKRRHAADIRGGIEPAREPDGDR